MTVEDAVDKYRSGFMSGRAEGMARILAGLQQGFSPEEILTDCMRDTPEVGRALKRELEMRGLVLGHDNKTVPRLRFHGKREAGAVFAGERMYRLLVWRIWNPELGLLGFVKHNPSSASHNDTDNTFTRGCGFGDRLGFGGVVFANAADRVATHPEDLGVLAKNQLTSGYNKRALALVLRYAQMVIVGWGEPATPAVASLIDDFIVQARDADRDLYCLGTNKSGQPRHLSARGTHRMLDDTQPTIWRRHG
jgi:hypothetical protein